MFLWCPMIGNNFLKVPENTVADWEKKNWFISRDSFTMLATNMEEQINDPLLYPTEITVEEAKLLPGVILQTSEFDYLRRETHLIIPKLKEAGVYVDHMDYAGEAHGFHVIP